MKAARKCSRRIPYEDTRMQVVNIVRWEEDRAWIGYLQEYPDYWTQGESLEDLRKHLRDLHGELTSGEILRVRKVGELVVS
jgi:predicted RNase H-like HicB family nuclease